MPIAAIATFAGNPARIERICDIAARYQPAALITVGFVVDPMTTMTHADLVLITSGGLDSAEIASRLAADLNGEIAPFVKVYGMTVAEFFQTVDDPASLAHRAANGLIMMPSLGHPRELREALRARRHHERT